VQKGKEGDLRGFIGDGTFGLQKFGAAVSRLKKLRLASRYERKTGSERQNAAIRNRLLGVQKEKGEKMGKKEETNVDGRKPRAVNR